MNINTRQKFNLTKSAYAVGIALCTLSSIGNAAYTPYSSNFNPSVDAAPNISGSEDVIIPVLANDGSDTNASTLSIATHPSNGTVAIDGENIIFTPNTGFTGTDSFTYQVTEIDWRTNKQNNTTNLIGVTAKAPIKNNYSEPGGTSSPIHNAQNAIGVWNATPVANGVIAKSYAPNSTTTALVGCGADDSNVSAISVSVIWNAERTGGINNGNMFTFTNASTPTPLGAGNGNIVLRESTSAPTPIKINGSGYNVLKGQIKDPSNPWAIVATANWVDLTPAQFQAMDITILASTVDGKMWRTNSTDFTAKVDYNQCTLKTATVKVTVSTGAIKLEPGLILGMAAVVTNAP